jgi:hypothetical protein
MQHIDLGQAIVQPNSPVVAGSFTPINFWNVNQPLRMVARDQLAWKSVTTGGVAGMIITLDRSDAGSLEIETL